MSTLSGLGNKAEKSKGKYTAININNIYKGTSVPTQKQPGKFTYSVINVYTGSQPAGEF